ncbi:MAG: hypothetical protein P8181_01325 [bacterium]
MNRTIIVAIIVVLAAAVAVLQPLVSGVIAVAVWIYLVWMIRKQSNKEFNNQMEPGIDERLLKKLKVILLIAGISFVVFVVSAILHNVLHGLYDIEETAFLLVTLVSLFVFVVLTGGGLVIFLKGR